MVSGFGGNCGNGVPRVKQEGDSVICVGTTSVRTLKSAARGGGVNPRQSVTAFEGPTNIFILPGYEFQVVDAMVTNFHLPKSTLLMMMSAFVGRERILTAYEEAKSRSTAFFFRLGMRC